MTSHGESVVHFCLVCGKELNKQKPVLVESESAANFKRAFHHFCRLLGFNDDDEEEGDLEDILNGAISVLEVASSDHYQVAFALPCCVDCCRALEQVHRLQQAIDEMQATQMGQVDRLKASIIPMEEVGDYHAEDKHFCQIRKLLLPWISTSVASHSSSHHHPPPVPRTIPGRQAVKRKRQETQPQSKQQKLSPGAEDALKKLRPCHVVLEHLSTAATPSPNPQEMEVVSGEVDDSSDPSITSHPPLKIKTESEDYSDVGGDFVPSPEVSTADDVDEDLASVDLAVDYDSNLLKNTPHALDNDDSSSDTCHDDGDDFVTCPDASVVDGDDNDLVSTQQVSTVLSKSEVPLKEEKGDPGVKLATQEKPSLKSKPRSITSVAKINLLFYKIDETTLLYKFTLIQVSNCGTQLKCLEQDCSTVLQDLDYASLFGKMRVHIDMQHSNKGTPRGAFTCPFPSCQDLEFHQATSFRAHLLFLHNCDHVICEICWKPIKDTGDSHCLHKWSHRNEQEKLELLPPTSLSTQLTYSKTERSRWLHEKVKSTPPTRWSVPSNEYFSKLSDDLLLYKYTVIKIIKGKGLSCEEPQCSGFIAEGTEYQAFEEVKGHVQGVHLFEGGGELYTSKSRKCPLCPEGTIFPEGHEMRSHLLSKEHVPRPFICQSCWKPVPSKYELTAHMLTHQPAELKVSKVKSTRKHICDLCGKMFPTTSKLRGHQQTHIPKDQRKLWACDKCPKTFYSRNSLTGHVQAAHLPPEVNRLRFCPICNQQFLWRDADKLAVHIRMHTHERPFVCDICGKGFPGEGNLRLHLRNVHTDGRKFQCEFCQMSYKNERSLRRHQLVSHGDKVTKDPEQSVRYKPPESRPDFIGPKIAFPCEICEKVFPLKCRLTQHTNKYHAGASEPE